MIISREKSIRDISTRRLERVFKKEKFLPILKMMTSGEIYDTWIEVMVHEVSDLVRAGHPKRYLLKYVDECTKQYAQSYLKGLTMRAEEVNGST